MNSKSDTGPDISDKGIRWPEKPWLDIWFKPQETIRAIIINDPGRHVILLAILTGIAQMLDELADGIPGESTTFTTILLLTLVVGPIVGVLSLYFFGAVYKWSGRLFGGFATAQEVRAALAWSSIPIIFRAVFSLPQLLLGDSAVIGLLGPAELVIIFWGLFIMIAALGEVHRLSTWRAIAAFGLPVVALFLLLFGFLLIIP